MRMGKKKVPIVEYKVNRKGSTPKVPVAAKPVKVKDDRVDKMIANLKETIAVMEMALNMIQEKIQVFKTYRKQHET